MTSRVRPSRAQTDPQPNGPGSFEQQIERATTLRTILRREPSVKVISPKSSNLRNSMLRRAPTRVLSKIVSTREQEQAISDLSEALGGDAKQLVDRDTFVKSLKEADISGLLAQRIFDWLAADAEEGQEGLVAADELLLELINFNNIDPEAQLQFMFHLWDTDNSGFIGADDMYEILKVCFNVMKLEVDDDALLRVALACLEKAAGDGEVQVDGEGRVKGPTRGSSLVQYAEVEISYNQLRDMVFEYAADNIPPKLRRSQSMVVRHASVALKRTTTVLLWPFQLVRRMTKQRYFLFYVVLWAGIIASFLVGYLKNNSGPTYDTIGASYPTAKGFGQVMQVVFALLIIPVTRHTVTTLRSTFLKRFIPFDDSITVHRLLGVVAFVSALAHTLAHMCNFARESSGDYNAAWKKYIGTKQPGTHIWGTEIAITGYIMMATMLAAYLFLLPWPVKPNQKEKLKVFLANVARKAGFLNFNNFYISHNLMFVIVYVCLIIHPYPGLPAQHKYHRSTTWIYIGIPLLMHVVERLYRLVNPAIRQTALVDVQTLPGAVTALRMRRPRGFNYSPGMYMFINIPQIAKHEWHPFTITSAPGDPYVSLHIRGVGDWTRALNAYMIDLRAKLMNKGIVASVFDNLDGREQVSKANVEDGGACGLGGPKASHISSLRNWRVQLPGAPPINLDGPFNAPAQNWERYDVLLFVGGGIGVTPFASVLADLVNKMNAHRCSRCAQVDSFAVRRAMGISLEKIYFHWVERESQPFSYFKYTLQTICNEDSLNLVEANIHLTGASAVKKTDLRHIITKMAHEAFHKRTGEDVVAGIRGSGKVLTGFGRPDWKEIVGKIVDHHPGKRVGVFICGGAPLVDAVHRACAPHQASRGQKVQAMFVRAKASLKARFEDMSSDDEEDIEAQSMKPMRGVKCIDVFSEHF